MTELGDQYNRVRTAWIDAEKRAAGAAAERDRLAEALRVIAGPWDTGPWIEVYRAAGGGYEGLQAIARAALDEAGAGE